MGRRSRRRSKQKSKSSLAPARSSKGRPWLKWIFITLGSLTLLTVICGAGAWIWFRHWLNGPEFRQLATSSIEKSLGASVELGTQSITTDSLTLESAELERFAPVSYANIEQIQASFDSFSLLKQELNIPNLTVSKASIDLDFASKPASESAPKEESASATPASPKPAAQQAKPWYQSYIPTTYVVQSARIASLDADATLSDGKSILLRGASVEASYDRNKSLKLDLLNADLLLPYHQFPRAKVDSLYSRFQNGTLSVTQCNGSVGAAQFRIDGAEWNSKSGDIDLTGGITHLDLATVLPESWIKKISGQASADFALSKHAPHPYQIRGKATVAKARLTALPVLDTIAAFTLTSRFRNIEFDVCEADVTYNEDGSWRAENIVIASEGLIRVEGSISCSAKEQLSGTLWVGIMPGILTHIISSEEKIFLDSSHKGKLGLFWTPVNIGGTLDNPTEDLSDRLIKAAGDRLFEIVPGTGQRVLRFGRDILDSSGDSLKPLPDAIRELPKQLPNAPDSLKDLPENLLGLPGKLFGSPQENRN